MASAAWDDLWGPFCMLSKTLASVVVRGSSKVVIACRKPALNCWGMKQHWLPCPVTECPSLGALRGRDQSPVFSLSIPGTCVFLPWEWIVESSHWMLSKPQINPNHSLSLNSDSFPSPTTSSYWVKIMTFRLWVCLRRGRWAFSGCHVKDGGKCSKIVTRGKLWLKVRGNRDTILGCYKNFLTIPAILGGNSLSRMVSNTG